MTMLPVEESHDIVSGCSLIMRYSAFAKGTGFWWELIWQIALGRLLGALLSSSF